MTGPVYRGVLLAAGGSRRFGGPVAKQLLEIGGEPAVRRAARRLLDSRLERLVVVTGHRGEAVRAALGGLRVETVHNTGWAEGQSGSVRAGLGAVAAGAAAVVFAPCDQPFLSAGLVDALVSRHERGGAAIVVPAWRGRRGAPALLDASLFGELAALRGDAGARQLFGRHAVAEVELDDEAPLLDFDTEEELAALLARRPGGGPATR